MLLAFQRSLVTKSAVCCDRLVPRDRFTEMQELRRLHSFVDTDMPELAGSAADYLNMLAQYRACLCAPDEFTATSSYKQV